jgi:hypothetical protein
MVERCSPNDPNRLEVSNQYPIFLAALRTGNWLDPLAARCMSGISDISGHTN